MKKEEAMMKKEEPTMKKEEATMKKEEPTVKKEEPTTKKEAPTTKKTEAKEEGVTQKDIRVEKTRRKKRIIYLVSALVLLIICVASVSYVAILSRKPRFILEELYVDSISNSSVIAKLSSTNPSDKSSVYYNNMRIYVRVIGEFETESVSLRNTVQKPQEVTTWRAIVANNNDNGKPSGSFQVRHGMTTGDVIVDMFIQWKSGIYTSSAFGLQVTCPVLLRLEDLSSTLTKPMSTCSSHLV